MKISRYTNQHRSMGELRLKIILRGHKTNTVTISRPTTPKSTSAAQTRKRKTTAEQVGPAKRRKEECLIAKRSSVRPAQRLTRSISLATEQSSSMSSLGTGSKAFSSDSESDTTSTHTSPLSSLASAAGHKSSWLISKGQQRLKSGERLDRDYTLNAVFPNIDQAASTQSNASTPWPILPAHQAAPKRSSIEDEIAAATGMPLTTSARPNIAKAQTRAPSPSAKEPSTSELTEALRKAIPGGQIELARKKLGISPAARPKQSNKLNAALLAAYEHVRDFEDFVADREALWMQEMLNKDREIEELERTVMAHQTYIKVLEEYGDELLKLVEGGRQKSL